LKLVEEGGNGADDYPQLMRQLRSITFVKGKGLFMPVRAALTGSIRGPELDKIFSLLEKQEILARLRRALSP